MGFFSTLLYFLFSQLVGKKNYNKWRKNGNRFLGEKQLFTIIAYDNYVNFEHSVGKVNKPGNLRREQRNFYRNILLAFFFCLTKNTHKTKHAKNKKRNTNILLKRGERRPIKKKKQNKKITQITHNFCLAKNKSTFVLRVFLAHEINNLFSHLFFMTFRGIFSFVFLLFFMFFVLLFELNCTRSRFWRKKLIHSYIFISFFSRWTLKKKTCSSNRALFFWVNGNHWKC